jgi:hypothetical protein
LNYPQYHQHSAGFVTLLYFYNSIIRRSSPSMLCRNIKVPCSFGLPSAPSTCTFRQHSAAFVTLSVLAAIPSLSDLLSQHA